MAASADPLAGEWVDINQLLMHLESEFVILKQDIEETLEADQVSKLSDEVEKLKLASRHLESSVGYLRSANRETQEVHEYTKLKVSKLASYYKIAKQMMTLQLKQLAELVQHMGVQLAAQKLVESAASSTSNVPSMTAMMDPPDSARSTSSDSSRVNVTNIGEEPRAGNEVAEDA